MALQRLARECLLGRMVSQNLLVEHFESFEGGLEAVEQIPVKGRSGRRIWRWLPSCGCSAHISPIFGSRSWNKNLHPLH